MLIVRNYSTDNLSDELADISDKIRKLGNEFYTESNNKLLVNLNKLHSVMSLLFKAFIIDKKLEHVFLDQHNNIKNEHKLKLGKYYTDDGLYILSITTNYLIDADLLDDLLKIDLVDIITPKLDEIFQYITNLSALE